MRKADISYAMMMRLNMLKRKQLPNITMEEFSYALVHGKWKDQIPMHTSTAIQDIFEISAEEIVTILTRLALTENARADISEFHDLMGGKRE